MTNKNQSGFLIIFALFFLAIFLVFTMLLLNYTTLNVKGVRQSYNQDKALYLAQSGIEKAISMLNTNPNYAGENDTPLGNGTFSIAVSSIDSNDKSITATGYIPSSTSPTAKIIVKAVATISSTSVSFRYGVQSGTGGFNLSGGVTINGNVYSNGNISATTGVHITGSAIAADPPALYADQVNNTPSSIGSCTSTTCITFGTSTAAQDFAQSFKISASEPLNNIQFYIKKVSTPSDATVRIVNDNSGVPATGQLMSGTLSAAAVTSSFGWVTVTLPATPVLDPSQTYWIVIDASANASKYYIIGANNAAYAGGSAMVGNYSGAWLATSPSTLDSYFQLYLGGGTSLIGGNSYTTGVYVGTTGTDDAWAHTVMGATVSGPLYCQTGSYTNKACNTSQADPAPQPMPLSDNNIQDRKDEASAGGTITGNFTVGSAGASLGPKVITGNLLVNGGGTLDVTGTLWVQGTLTLTGGGKIKLDSSYGPNDGAIIVDGYVAVNGGSNFAGSGQAGSYPFLITTSACPAESGCNGNNAVLLSGGAGTVAIVAQNGNVQIDGGSSLKAVTGKEITMDGGASLIYDSGLINANFSSGPGGSWTYSHSTYTIVP